jgi:hypothetical protein
MKVKIKDLEFNPFRNLKLVPIDPLTVDKLKTSIERSGLWVGMKARPKDNDWKSGKYQIPYAHHRLVALQELGVNEIDIPIEEISDFDMVIQMVQENMTQRGMSVEIIMGTVGEVKEFLDKEINKYKSWDEAKKSLEIKRLFEKENNPLASYAQVKSKGVGTPTIRNFLNGAIEEWRITSAMDLIKHDDIDLDAVNLLNSTGQVEGFKRAIRKINTDRKEKGKDPIPKSEHKRLAELTSNLKATGKTGGGNYYNSIEGKIRKEVDDLSDEELIWTEVYSELEAIKTDTQKLADKISLLNTKLDYLGVEQIKSLSSLSLINNMARLLTNTNVLANTLGVRFNETKELVA